MVCGVRSRSRGNARVVACGGPTARPNPGSRAAKDARARSIGVLTAGVAGQQQQPGMLQRDAAGRIVLDQHHVLAVTADDLPDTEEDEAETAGGMGDFVASIGGVDDY